MISTDDLFLLPMEIIRFIFRWIQFEDIMRFDSALTNTTIRNEWERILTELMPYHPMIRHSISTDRYFQSKIQDIWFDKYLFIKTKRGRKETTECIQVWEMCESSPRLKKTFIDAQLIYPLTDGCVIVVDKKEAAVYNLDKEQTVNKFKIIPTGSDVNDIIQLTQNTVVLLLQKKNNKKKIEERSDVYVWNLQGNRKPLYLGKKYFHPSKLMKISDSIFAVCCFELELQVWASFSFSEHEFAFRSVFICSNEKYLIKHNGAFLVLSDLGKKDWDTMIVWNPLLPLTPENIHFIYHKLNEYQLFQLSDNRIVLFIMFQEKYYLIIRPIYEFTATNATIINFPYGHCPSRFSSFCELSTTILVSTWHEKNLIFVWHLDTETVEPIKSNIPVETCLRLSEDSFLTSCKKETYLTVWKKNNF